MFGSNNNIYVIEHFQNNFALEKPTLVSFTLENRIYNNGNINNEIMSKRVQLSSQFSVHPFISKKFTQIQGQQKKKFKKTFKRKFLSIQGQRQDVEKAFCGWQTCNQDLQ